MSDAEAPRLGIEFALDAHAVIAGAALAHEQSPEAYLETSIELGAAVLLRYLDNELFDTETLVVLKSADPARMNTHFPVGETITAVTLQYIYEEEPEVPEESVEIILDSYHQEIAAQGAELVGLSQVAFLNWCLGVRRLIDRAVDAGDSVWITALRSKQYEQLSAVLNAKNPEIDN